ncbi:hypothetical protein [Mycobacterium tuberculosis]
MHPATRDMALEKALDGLPMPLHPGAPRSRWRAAMPG